MNDVTVILPTYNSEPFLKNTIESIVSQSFQDFILVIIDDGSTDQTNRIINFYADKYRNIRLIKNEQNLGLAASLNKAIEKFPSKFFIRCDADDINHQNRFEILTKKIKSKGNLDVCGSNANLVYKDTVVVSCMPLVINNSRGHKFPNNFFIHSSVIIKSSFFEKNGLYDKKLKRAQDYDLWIRGLKNGSVYANIEEPLIDYRTNNYKRTWKTIISRHKALICIGQKYGFKNVQSKMIWDTLKLISKKVQL